MGIRTLVLRRVMLIFPAADTVRHERLRPFESDRPNQTAWVYIANFVPVLGRRLDQTAELCKPGQLRDSRITFHLRG